MRSRDAALDVVLSVAGAEVRLTGGGVDVSAPHGGVRPGLVHALHDVWRERARSGEVVSRPRGDVAVKDLAVVERPGLVSLRSAGVLLAESFLPEPVAVALRGLVERAVREHLVLRLGVAAPELGALPWEALPDPVTGQPLALHPHVVMYRRTGASAGSRLAGPLRIVVAIASPEHGGGVLLDYERELRSVVAAVRQARRFEARVEVVPFATTAGIRAALDVPGGVHVLHISAHGRPGVLVLEDEAGHARPVTAAELVAEAIPPGRMPPVVALAACYTDADGEEQGSSFAGRLAERGACAVIGTQTSVSDRYATLLFARVYAELAASSDPDVLVAVCEARRRVQADLLAGGDGAAHGLAGMDEWGVVTVSAGGPQVPVIDHRQERVAGPVVRSARWGPVEARPVGQFVGRRALQRTLPGVLAGDEGAGLVLHGIGGIGKTTLAAEILRRTVDADPSWQVVPLYGVVDPDVILRKVGAAVRLERVRRGVAPGAAVQFAGQVDVPWPDRLTLLRDDVLADVPVLLVLDNFEDNLDQATVAITDEHLAAFLAAWVADPGRSRILITSRHPFALPGGAESELRVVPVGPMSAAETGKLLWSLPNIDRHATNRETTEQVWRIVGGHPRSLEYLDALLGHGDARFDDITDRLGAAAELRLGAQQAREWLAQDRTLAAALADTVTLAADDVLLTAHLDRLATIEGTIEVLMAVSVYREPVPTLALAFHTGTPKPLDQATADTTSHHARRQRLGEEITALLAAYDLTPELMAGLDDDGPFTPDDRDALRQLVGAVNQPPPPPYTEPAVLAGILEVLAASSLIHLDPATGIVFMHRWTATELEHRWQRTATLDPGKNPILRAHQAAAAYWQWRVDQWPQDRVADVHDMHEARHHAVTAGDQDTAGTLTEYLCSQLRNWGAWDQATTLIHDTLRWLPTTSPRYTAYIHTLGNLAYLRGDHAEAERRYQQALTISEQRGDQAGIGGSHHQLGMLAQARGDYTEAEHRYQQSLTISEQLGDQASIGRSHGQLGILAQLQGDYAEAEHRYQQALTISEQLGDQASIGGSHHQLGILAQDRGDYTEAEHRYQQALTISEQLGDQASIGDSHHQLGNLAYLRGHYAEAEHRYQQSLTIDEQLGDQAGIGGSHHQLGILAQARGDYAEAEHRYQQSLTIKEQLGDQAGIATSRSQLAILRAATGDTTAAIHLHILALAIRLTIGAPQTIDITRLIELRDQVGTTSFADTARQVIDLGSYTNLIAVLDTHHREQ
ncbi:tetratricopeptide repeat protein [Actinoplanes sp. NPDC051851]|uniref:tetratricopeptide repeat protein n=1 Tax=Actinoplanes sp. NPDC051851 TaxID=3154753 RepID=UPI003447C883